MYVYVYVMALMTDDVDNNPGPKTLVRKERTKKARHKQDIYSNGPYSLNRP